jgi:hypothetical protein
VTRTNTFLRRSKAYAVTRVPTLLDITGATLLSVGANAIYAPAGWIVGGLSVLAINRLMHDG